MPVRSARDAALNVVRRLRAKGHVALWAGGCVRDMLLGHEPADYDVATDATPEQVRARFRSSRAVGQQFGVVLVRQGRWWIEVARFRKDLEYTDGRHPDQVEFATAEEDAQRRDFTVNGMFFDPLEQRIIDHVGGRDDLERRVIRAIGDPQARFAEDSLRMLRAVRFASRLAFALDPATQAAITRHASDVKRVSPERVREELEKMLTDPRRARGVELATQCGLVDHLWSQPDWTEGRARITIRTLKNLPDKVSHPLGMAGLLTSYSPETANRICRELRCSNHLRRTTVWLLAGPARLEQPQALSLADLKMLMAHRAFDDLLRFLGARLAADDRSLEPLESVRERAGQIPKEHLAPTPLLTGDHLTSLGFAPGPRFGPTLDAVYRAQLDETIATYDQAVTLAREIWDQLDAGPRA